jgi:hypothetical protein
MGGMDEPDAGMGMDMDAGGGMGGGGTGGMGGAGSGGGGSAGMGGAGSGGGGSAGMSGAGSGGGGGGNPNPVQLEAESATLTGCTVEGGGDSGSKVISFEQGDSICWNNVDMDGITMATIHHGNGETLGDMVSLDYDGDDLGQIAVLYTGGWSSPMLDDVTLTFAAQSGTGQVCLTGTGTGWIASIDYVDLE